MTQQALRELVVKWRAEAELHPLKTLAPGGVCPELALEKCADDLESLLGEQREAEGAAVTQTTFNTWHPIETAPKDGRWVILHWANEVTPGFYLDNSKTVYPWEGWSRGSGQVMLKGVPQHWMPFPTYP